MEMSSEYLEVDLTLCNGAKWKYQKVKKANENKTIQKVKHKFA